MSTAPPTKPTWVCTNCGYTLYETSHLAACPECGQSVAVSIRGERKSLNASIVLVVAGAVYAVAAVASFFVVIIFDRFAVFDPPYQIAVLVTLGAAVATVIAFALARVRFHWVAYLLFALMTAGGTLLVFGLIHVALASV